MNELEQELRFQTIPFRNFGASPLEKSKDGSFWKKFRTRSANQNGGVSCLDFSPTEPHQLAATSGTRVVVYDEVRAENHSTQLTQLHAFSKFKDVAHSGTFRVDGRLLVAGSEEGTVKVFNCSDRSLLRKFNGHKRAVHVSRFCVTKTRVLSGSDDATVRVWDLSESKQLVRLDGHRDYVRAGDQSPTSIDIWATGGYDHVCRVWDVRSKSNIMDLDHGAPIESIAFLPSGTLMVTAGGTYLKIWDVLNTGQTLRKLEKHHKTITSVGVLRNVRQVNGPRLCSVSLDQHLKIYDLDEFKVVHDSRYQHSILSFAAESNGRCYAVGMSNGVVICRDNKHKHIEDKTISEANEDFTTPMINTKRYKQSESQKLIRQFKYRDALDRALKTEDTQIITTLLEELSARDGVMAALSGRDVETLVPILKYIEAHISDSNVNDHVLPLLQIILDLYDKELATEKMRKILDNILRKMQKETALIIEMKELKGCLESMLCCQWY